MKDYTDQQYRCLEIHCRHRGPAMGEVVVQSHGENATETLLEDLVCASCGGSHIEPIEY
jgi:hypothetical protein